MKCNGLAVFDIDHTLIRVNSHYEFAERFLREKAPVRYLVYRLGAWEPIRKALSYASGDDFRRRLSAFLFKPFSKNDLKAYANVMFTENLPAWFNQDVVKILEVARTKNMVVLAASATLDFIAEALAEQMKIGVVSSVYENGRIEFDATGKKIELIQSKYPGMRINVFVSDNGEDVSEIPEYFVLVASGHFFVRAQKHHVIERCFSVGHDPIVGVR